MTLAIAAVLACPVLMLAATTNDDWHSAPRLLFWRHRGAGDRLCSGTDIAGVVSFHGGLDRNIFRTSGKSYG
jgi:hypothetical protein